VRKTRKIDRIHSINLSPLAEEIWRRVKKVLPRGYLSELVSEVIIKKFGNDKLKKKLATEMIRILENKKIRLTNKIGAQQQEWYELLK